MLDGFGNAKINYLGHRDSFTLRDQDIRRFQIAMDDPFLMRVLYAAAHRYEKFQALPHRKLLALAVIGKLLSHDQLHHKEGPACVRCPDVQYARDIGMIHCGQRLPLNFESRHCHLRIHSMFEDLKCDPALDWLLLLRYVNGGKTALADLLEQQVPSDYGSRPVHFIQPTFGNEKSRLPRTQAAVKRSTASLKSLDVPY